MDKKRVRYAVDLQEKQRGAVSDISVGCYRFYQPRKAGPVQNLGLKRYVKASDITVFSPRPAGTKNLLAVALAVLASKTGTSAKIILTRPAVEAGKKLGFYLGTSEQGGPTSSATTPVRLFRMAASSLFRKKAPSSAPLRTCAADDERRVIYSSGAECTVEQMKMSPDAFGEGSKLS